MTENGHGPIPGRFSGLPYLDCPGAGFFAISCFIAFATGTSWGTFAIMIPIAVPMIALLPGQDGLLLAAVLGGGIFGDHCSPISDTTIISSMASGSDHIDHVKTQLPYAVLVAAVTGLIYVVLGWTLQG